MSVRRTDGEEDRGEKRTLGNGNNMEKSEPRTGQTGSR